MNKNTGIIIGVIALLVIVGGVYVSVNNKDNAVMVREKMEQQTVEDKEVMVKDDATNIDNMMRKVDTSMVDKSDTMMKVGSYEAYSADKIAQAVVGDVVLFFHASWCPSCRALNGSIESNLKSIPESVTILKIDYDRETELKKKYGVTYQHTLVQVDKDGHMIKKWSGSPSLDSLLTQIQ